MKEHQNKAKVVLIGQSSDLKVNLTHSLYNKMMNMDRIFDSDKEEEDVTTKDSD